MDNYLHFLEEMAKSMVVGFAIGLVLRLSKNVKKRTSINAKKHLRLFLFEKLKITKEDVLKYSDAFRCYKTQEIIQQPVVDQNGKSFEKNPSADSEIVVNSNLFENRMLRDFMALNKEKGFKYYTYLKN